MNDEKNNEQDNEDSSGPLPPGSPDSTPVKEPETDNNKIRDPALPDQNKPRL